MWQLILDFLAEWLRKPTGLANAGMVLGLLLFLVGVIGKNRRERILGLATLGLSLVAGIVQFVYG
ncbi:MAG: hypothetical protein ABI904_06775 [Chloroflexota bacterium]